MSREQENCGLLALTKATDDTAIFRESFVYGSHSFSATAPYAKFSLNSF